MKYFRIIDQFGNKEDVETEFVPRIGEHVARTFRIGSGPLSDHFYRVKDVEYWFDHEQHAQVRILVEEIHNHEDWPTEK